MQIKLPQLAYSYHALEPYIDGKTMELHHTKHHQGYVTNLNKALKDTSITTSNLALEKLFEHISNHSIAIRNHGGGHYNHTLFWRILSPNPKKNSTGPLAQAIANTFGSIEAFKAQFNQTAASHFGAGWAWLSVDRQGTLQISATPNQDNPLMDLSTPQGTPILGLDVWEHAYYLKYQNKRLSYIEAFWQIANWEAIEKNYEKALTQI